MKFQLSGGLPLAPFIAVPPPPQSIMTYPLIPAPLGPVPSPIIPPHPKHLIRAHRRYSRDHPSLQRKERRKSKSRSRSVEKVITTEDVVKTYTGLDKIIAEEFIEICDSKNNSLSSGSSCPSKNGSVGQSSKEESLSGSEKIKKSSGSKKSGNGKDKIGSEKCKSENEKSKSGSKKKEKNGNEKNKNDLAKNSSEKRKTKSQVIKNESQISKDSQNSRYGYDNFLGFYRIKNEHSSKNESRNKRDESKVGSQSRKNKVDESSSKEREKIGGIFKNI